VTPALLSLAISYENDVVQARQRARQIAELLGFDVPDQSRIATAVSEIARNAVTYAGRGAVEFRIRRDDPPGPRRAGERPRTRHRRPRRDPRRTLPIRDRDGARHHRQHRLPLFSFDAHFAAVPGLALVEPSA
jgi:hypothetical protein